MILRGAGDAIDWTRFVGLSRTHRVTLFATAALEALGTTLGLEVPDGVWQSLRAVQSGVVDRTVFRVARSDSRGRPLGRVQWHVARFLRGTPGLSAWARVRRLPAFLRGWLVVDSWSAVAGGLIYRSGRAVAIRAGLLSRNVVSGKWLKMLERASAAAQSNKTSNRRAHAAKTASRHIR
jgi:hypothetical protein